MAFSSHPSAVVMLFCFVGLGWLNYLLGGRDVLYPAFIFCVIWAVATLVYLFCPMEIDDLSWQTVLIFVGGCVSITVGCLLGSSLFTKGKVWFAEPARNHQGDTLLLLLCLLLLPAYVLIRVRMAGTSILSADFLINSKIGTIVTSLSVYESIILLLTSLLSTVTFWILLLERRSKFLIALTACVVFFVCISGGQRGTLFLVICGACVIKATRYPTRTLKSVAAKAAAAGGGAVLLMILISLATKSETQGFGGLQIALRMAAEYIAGPLAAFNYQVMHPTVFSGQPWNTLTPLLSPLAKWGGLHIQLPPINEEFVSIPFLTNVFTIYKPYYHDVGAVGCVIVFLLIGVVYGAIFRASIRGNQFAIFVFAFGSEGLIMSIFHDSFNYQLTEYGFMLCFGWVYFIWLRRNRSVKIKLLAKHGRPPASGGVAVEVVRRA
jgi:oligosaccharide repeat unit polymerase